MALIKCRECGRQISDEAMACPQCGAKQHGSGLVAWLIVGAVVVGAISSFSGGDKPPSAADRIASAQGACLLLVKRTLHDPDSAEFPSTAIAQSDGNGTWTVRRQVRAKNALNAYRLAEYECVMREQGENWVTVSIRQVPE